MAETERQGFEGLYSDLLALSENRLPNVDRLFLELEKQIAEFKNLLDKPKKNDESRKKLSAEKITIDNVEYSLNDEFKQETIKIADALDLDEIQSAKLCILAQEETRELDRSVFAASLISFHRRREFLLESLRLAVRQVVEPYENEIIAEAFKNFLSLVLETEDGKAANGPKFWRRCLSSMGDIEKWLQQLAERIQSVSMVGQTPSPEDMETFELQRFSLTRQHESLAAISSDLVKCGHANIEGLRSLLITLKTLDKHDVMLVHYVPILTCLVNRFGSAENSCSLSDARALHKTISSIEENDHWILRGFQGAAIIWWLAEYSGRYTDNPAGTPLQGVDLDAEADARSSLFMDSLKDGALHFILSVSRDVRGPGWYDPAKSSLVAHLLQETAVLPADSIPFTTYFQDLLKEQLQSFIDAFISNMPDTLRKLKIEEDDQRRQIHSRLQRGSVEYDLHLERFLIIASYAFERSPEASQAFWADTDGNFYGFLQWAAKRLTTPRAAAFCDLLRSISGGMECAESAHKFLLEDRATSAGRSLRTGSLSYNQIFSELEFYASRMKDRPSATGSPNYATAQDLNIPVIEAESPLMLESYLRLISHICQQSKTARDWIISHPSFHLAEVLLSLCASPIDGRLRACAFDVLASLLTEKVPEAGELLWTALDSWVNGGSNPPTAPPKPGTPVWNEQRLFETLAAGFEESVKFVDLLRALMEPYSDDVGLYDTLPFPENLGSTYRIQGIESYVDFAVGKVFAAKSPEIQDPEQLQILRYSCLKFIFTCLTTFNEDLVIFANRSNIAVDAAIQSSSLSTYARLHPFARVMEWLFTEKALKALFSAAHQDISDVNNASGESSLVASLELSINVMDLIMKLQSTYIDIVRPLVRQNANIRKMPVPPSALASFEDAVLNHLQLIVDLGLYCGTAHKELSIVSLRLLERLSSSRKLVASYGTGFGQRSHRSKIISILEQNQDAERIAKSLISELHLNFRELEAGPEATGYVIKRGILDFLNSCIITLPNRPTLAHLVLGFSCSKNAIDVPEDGLFANGASLFHAVLGLAVEYPNTFDSGSFTSWLSAIKTGALEVLRRLWRSPISSVFTMSQLRVNEFLFSQAINQIRVDSQTLWDGNPILDRDFLFKTSATAFHNFLVQRSIYYEHAAMELRNTSQVGMPTLRSRIQSTLLGKTILGDGQQVQNLDIFDLFDFVELVPERSYVLPNLMFLGDLDFSICKRGGPLSDTPYDLTHVGELIILRINELRKAGLISNPNDEQQAEKEKDAILHWLDADNQRGEIIVTQQEVLKSWVQLMTVMLQSCEFEASFKTSFILQALQVILPKLERAYTESIETAVQLAGLSRTLLQSIDADSPVLEKHKISDFTNDRLSQLFRVALNGIFSAVTTYDLREICYQICYRYLKNASKGESKASPLGRHSLRAVKTLGDNLMDVICDDACAGQGTCRVSALLFLDSLVSLSIKEESKYMIDTFVRLNFISVLVDGIKNIHVELRMANPSDVPLLLSYYDASLSLILRISQTRLGAAHALNAGLFQSVRESQIFSVDPDIGLDFENPNALKKHFELMVSVLRVINAVVVARGPQNEQTLQLARHFLKENRPSMVGIFKRHAGFGVVQPDTSGDLSDLVDNYMVLISATDFLHFEDQTDLKRSALAVFT